MAKVRNIYHIPFAVCHFFAEKCILHLIYNKNRRFCYTYKAFVFFILANNKVPRHYCLSIYYLLFLLPYIYGMVSGTLLYENFLTTNDVNALL